MAVDYYCFNDLITHAFYKIQNNIIIFIIKYIRHKFIITAVLTHRRQIITIIKIFETRINELNHNKCQSCLSNFTISMDYYFQL